jgi:hypothetical protein
VSWPGKGYTMAMRVNMPSVGRVMTITPWGILGRFSAGTVRDYANKHGAENVTVTTGSMYDDASWVSYDEWERSNRG